MLVIMATSRGDQLIVGAAVAQVVLLLLSLVITYLTVREGRAARKDEHERFIEMRVSEQRRLRAESSKARLAEREARIRQVVDSIADYEELRNEAMGGSPGALLRAGSLRVRLQTAIIATGRDLPDTMAYLNASDPFADPETIQPALDELQESLRIYAVSSHIPFEGEAG
jgi:hypothetical protein